MAKLPDWVLVQKLAYPLQPITVSGSIGPGEREVISLGLELGAAHWDSGRAESPPKTRWHGVHAEFGV